MQKIKRLACWGLKYGVFAWAAVALVWYVIVSTLRNGISCDEGYYLLGYLRNQSIEVIGTDFHSIVRALSRPFPDNDIMVFRYLRLVLNVVAVALFAGASYEWLSRKKGLCLSRWAYYPMIALAGAMSFTFAAPTISYDSIESIVVLSAASLLFLLFTSDRELVKSICAFGIGFLLWFACTNYPPAGLCIVCLFLIACFLELRDKKWRLLLKAILGVVVAVLVYHYFVHDIKDWFSNISKVFVSTFTEESKSRHDAGHLVSGLLLTVVKDFLIFIPLVAVFTVIYKKIHISDIVQWTIVLLVCAGLIIFRKAYELRSTLILIPVALVLAKVLARGEPSIKGFLFSKSFFLILTLIAIPIAGVFGTNQPIMKKAIIYSPFWVAAFFCLSAMLKEESTKRLVLLYAVVLFAGYIWLGNFQRYHYYYTPRSSKIEIVGAFRPQKVLISQYQQEYYRDLLDTLKASDCKPGDKYMAFGENQMAVYLAGGYIDGRLPYHWWQYKHFERVNPKAFVLFKNEEDGVISHFKGAGWDFPEKYNRMEMRQMSQNMGDDYRTVIYVKIDQ